MMQKYNASMKEESNKADATSAVNMSERSSPTVTVWACRDEQGNCSCIKKRTKKRVIKKSH